MKLQLIGLNHKTAPVELRERFAIPEWRIEEATRKLLEHPGVEECVVFSTCNRVEFAACSQAGTDLHAFLHSYIGADPSQFREYMFEHTDKEVIRHIFRVAASLDSMIVGEPQILGQVKYSYSVGKPLDQCGQT